MGLKELLEKQGLEAEKVEGVLNAMKEEKLFITNEENIDERYGKLKLQKESVETELQEANALVGELKKTTTESEANQKLIDDYKTTIESLQTQSSAQQKQSAIDLALVKAQARNPKAVNALLDADKIEMTEDGIKGLEEQLEALKESEAYMFQVESDPGRPHIINPEDPNGSSGEDKDAFASILEKY